MKPFVCFVFALLMILPLCACAADEAETQGPDPSQVAVANPFAECSTMSAAQKGAGFEMSAPETLGGAEPVIRVMKGYMIELIYELDAGQLRIRKAVGEGDISGDYTQYAVSSVVSVGGVEVTLRGEAEGSYSVAVWTAEGYSYSVTTPGGSSREFMLELAGSVA